MSDCAVADSPVESSKGPGGYVFTDEDRAKGRAAFRANLEKAKESETVTESVDPYVAARIVRTRKQIEDCQSLIDSTKESADWDRLTRALQRLVDVYCKLAGIPDPGSYRPAKPRGRQAAERITPE